MKDEILHVSFDSSNIKKRKNATTHSTPVVFALYCSCEVNSI